MIPLFKSRYSMGKSILEISEKRDQVPKGVDNILDIAIENKLDTLHFVEDSMLGFIPIEKACKKYGIRMIFGLRMNFCNDLKNPSKDQLHKNIVFLKEKQGYKSLVKLATVYGTNVFEGNSVIDYENYHKLADGVELVVPFYDSYLYNNNLSFSNCLPDFRGLTPNYFLEYNELPQDREMAKEITNLIPKNRIFKAQSIFYKEKKDVFALQVRKIIHNRKNGKASLEKPELDGFASDCFCWENFVYANR